ncbi:MAG: LysR family transcriptional regulator [Polyangiaceae bacterium]|nr:LysR family transcriptional regulator [Polyangiaceae bacterium]
MADNLSGLEALLLVAEKRSFTAAAAALRVTPSAVSQTVRALEERVGVRLCQRTTRSVGLTEAGERFVARLRPAMAEVRSAFDALGDLRDRPAGTLRLNIPRIAFERVLEPNLEAFLEAYPEIHLDIVIDDAFVDIIESGFDAGIRIGEWIDREMIAVRIGGDERAAIVGSPSYFERHPKPKRPRDLQHHDCINYRRIRTGEIYRWELTEDGKDVEIAVHGRVVVNDGDGMLRAAMAGAGLAYVFESVARPHIREGKLVRVLDAFCPPFPGLYLYYPSRANLAPKLQVLVDFLKQRAPRRR